ncbi:MAG: ABC transporter ATP-binding protein [Candidatus Limiplasma sp.]|jgi:ATP-binding cassette subfamily B multidrug efflux pump|nr:ABC transporter ATP-binding protein/permease [Clostridiales bacterium]MDY4062825.1 ABC transporter ATP-binding protein [Candidatus Limiplasma sp.]
MARNKFDVDETLESPFQWKHLKRAFQYISRHRFQMLGALGLSVLASICTLYTPKIMSKVLDEVVPAGDVQTLVRWALIYCGLIVVSIVFTVIRARVMAYVSQEIIFDIRRDLFHHLQELPFSYYDSRPAGKILVRVINYVNSVSDILSNGIINSILEIINVAVIIVFMYSVDATLATVVVSGLPVFIAIVCILKPRQRKAWQQQSNKNSNYNAYLAESIDGVKVSQLFARQEVNCSIMKRLALACRDAWMKAMYVSNAVWLSSECLTQIVFSLLYIAGVYWLGGGKMVSFGVILAMASYVSRFWQPITNLANIYNSFVNNIAYLERIFETMDEPVEVKDVPGAEPLKALDGEVTFENVEFGYEEGQTVLENLNLHVRAGERIALVGPTGAGKSTVINLLCRFYNLRGGRILLHCADGTTQDIAGATLHSLRSQLGIMLQDSFLFAGTIMDNIRYGRLDATDEEVMAAAKAVRAHEFISQMPQQYATPVNERGGGLSQGQRQLIAFARTLLSDPRILILDEATSSIDTQTERLLQQGIETLLQGRTSFIVAHRLSTIKSCDRILYIGNKGILESGSHDELMAKKGYYYELYTAQTQAA